MKKVIVLPGAEAQIPLLKKLKGMGYYTISFNPYTDSPAFPYADTHDLVDILDKSKCLELARKYSPSAILSDECDIAMPTVAYLSEQLGTHSLGARCAALFTNKSQMRDFCVQHHLPTPLYRICNSVDDAYSFFRTQSSGKCILKPLDSNSSRGVFTIEQEEEIAKYWERTIGFSHCQHAVLIEQYIDGVEFTVDGIVTTEGHKSLAISEKKHYAYNKNIAYELFFSHTNAHFDYDLLRSTNDTFVNLSSLPVGCLTHAEYKYQNGNFYLIEIAARGGGNFISSDIVPIMSGVDNYAYLINSFVERKTAEPISAVTNLSERCAVLHFFDIPHQGIVRKIEGEDFLQNSPQILRYGLHFKIGDKVQKADNDSSRVGYYIAYAESRQALLSLMEQIDDTFKIIID